jgi:hypothetical protein
MRAYLDPAYTTIELHNPGLTLALQNDIDTLPSGYQDEKCYICTYAIKLTRVPMFLVGVESLECSIEV